MRAMLAGRLERRPRRWPAQALAAGAARPNRWPPRSTTPSSCSGIRREQGADARARGGRARPSWPPTRAARPGGRPWPTCSPGRTSARRRRPLLDELAARDFADIPQDGDWMTAVTLLSDVITRAAATRRGRPRLYELLYPYRRQNVVIGLGAACLGAACRYLGRLAATAGRRGAGRRALRAGLGRQRAAGRRGRARPHPARLRRAARAPAARAAGWSREAAARTAEAARAWRAWRHRAAGLRTNLTSAPAVRVEPMARGATLPRLMAKTLIIAEKPSVGRDVTSVLPGAFTKGEGFLEGPEHIVTWAVGHLVQLADPDEYDDKFKKWRMADLPIVPERFRLVVRDERSKKQMTRGQAPARPRRRRARRQRLRRRARGRAHLRLPV